MGDPRENERSVERRRISFAALTGFYPHAQRRLARIRTQDEGEGVYVGLLSGALLKRGLTTTAPLRGPPASRETSAKPLGLPMPPLLTFLLLFASPAHPAAPPTLEAVDAELRSIDGLIANKDWVTAEARADLHHHKLKHTLGEDHVFTAIAAYQLALTRLVFGDQGSAFVLLAQAMPILVTEYGHAEPAVAFGENPRVALAARRPDSLSVPEIREAREEALKRR